MESGFGDFLRVSLALLRAECPFAHARMCEAIAPRSVLLEVDGEPVALAARPDRIVLLGATLAEPAVRLRTGRATILDLVDGRRTLLDAIRADALNLIGPLEDLLCFHDGLMAYLHGAVRSPSFPGLLERYRVARPARSRTRSIESKGGEAA